ncbi:hypothetical protein DICSQDRAFT_68489 [Dichomitus squalens LYAD-421 SS1]|uniref:Uncharacterized protein n=2 Tax=Dichomitus squalens TaxID=114155 RepID=A0A4Q9M6K6_9APHY|nr:uncharacterized protein DICSQDRAFT_68489 [Dichomitus squalens LYAD-421 SS1]EJF57804.1 hypothetical protein DICSQDRAFT_68489 [Dichomitus squalens LYAD-421 SS1]TBU22585.1 hypothetical protein BD311DRAFT_675786 [Dichomitus squalens]TBU55359.1 hypothetical protein BD310DRAFT_950821 [Dichomitus squalens]
MHKVLFPLNDTIVVFLHQDDTRSRGSHVVQITVKAERPQAIDTITTYYLVRHDLSDLILRLVTAHLEQPVQDDIVFDDPRYTIHAHRDAWTFGRQLSFYWGDDRLEAAEDKWTFWFRMKRHASPDTTL